MTENEERGGSEEYRHQLLHAAARRGWPVATHRARNIALINSIGKMLEQSEGSTWGKLSKTRDGHLLIYVEAERSK